MGSIIRITRYRFRIQHHIRRKIAIDNMHPAKSIRSKTKLIKIIAILEAGALHTFQFIILSEILILGVWC